jgi:hypothetical protein
MHSLTICFGPAATAWTLLFKNAESAVAASKQISNGDTVIDDFGQAIGITSPMIHGIAIEDMDLAQEAQIERGLHQARTQAKAQKEAMDDPVIKDSIRRQQMGPAVFQPGMPNGRGMA